MSSDNEPEKTVERSRATEIVSTLPISSSTIEAISKCALLGSAALYGIGLLIANFSAQLYGRYSLGLVEAQYVLVGLLWLTLLLFGFAISYSAVGWLKGRGPWKGRPLKQNLKNAVSVTGAWLGHYALFAYALSLLGVPNVMISWNALVILGIVLWNVVSISALFQETWNDLARFSQPGDSFFVKLSKTDRIEIVKRILYFFTSLSLYATVVYPQLAPAVGGGRLHQARIIIRQDQRALFDGMEAFKIDKDGKLGPIAVVAELDDAFIITTISESWWTSSRPSLQLKKDLVELVIYTK